MFLKLRPFELIWVVWGNLESWGDLRASANVREGTQTGQILKVSHESGCHRPWMSLSGWTCKHLFLVQPTFSPWQVREVREVRDLKFCSLPWTLSFQVAQTSVWCHTPDTPETPRSRSESVFGLQSWRHKKLLWKSLEFIRLLFPHWGCLRRFRGFHMFWKVLG